jgi:hypothetical protein
MKGAKLRMTLHSCKVDDRIYSIAWMDVASPADVDATARALVAAARANVSADEATSVPLSVAGSTPQPASGRWAWSGRWPDGRPVQQQTAVFSRGLRIYQATITGASVDAPGADRFFEGLRWP